MKAFVQELKKKKKKNMFTRWKHFYLTGFVLYKWGGVYP